MNNLSTNLNVSKCRLCNSTKLIIAKKSGLKNTLSSVNFSITDSDYGQTLDLFKCLDCGLLQSLNLNNVVDFYEKLEDYEYENTREERGLQASKILGNLKKFLSSGSLIDVGAGSGILVEQAIKFGYDTIGIEPSVWLQKKAIEHKLPVILGTLPHDNIKELYDAVTLVDVIEHVEDPVGVLLNIKTILKNGGYLLLTTPDVDSFFAKILGWRWWHFRVAHINYFNLKTIKLLLDKTGFEILTIKRPCWYFTSNYLLERANLYLPKFLRFKLPSVFKKIIIPLNLFDSFEIICRVK